MLKRKFRCKQLIPINCLYLKPFRSSTQHKLYGDTGTLAIKGFLWRVFSRQWKLALKHHSVQKLASEWTVPEMSTLQKPGWSIYRMLLRAILTAHNSEKTNLWCTAISMIFLVASYLSSTALLYLPAEAREKKNENEDLLKMKPPYNSWFKPFFCLGSMAEKSILVNFAWEERSSSQVLHCSCITETLTSQQTGKYVGWMSTLRSHDYF